MGVQKTLNGEIVKEKKTDSRGSSKNAIAKVIALVTGALIAQTVFDKKYLEPFANMLQDVAIEIVKAVDQPIYAIVAAGPVGDQLSNAAVAIILGGVFLYSAGKTIDKYIK